MAKLHEWKTNLGITDGTPPRQQSINFMDVTPRQCDQVVIFRTEPIWPFEIPRFMKKFVANAYHSRLTELENKSAHSYQKEREKRKAVGQKVIHKGGIITINDVRAKVQRKEVDAVAKAERQIRRTEKEREKAVQEALIEANLPYEFFRALHGKHAQLVIRVRNVTDAAMV